MSWFEDVRNRIQSRARGNPGAARFHTRRWSMIQARKSLRISETSSMAVAQRARASSLATVTWPIQETLKSKSVISLRFSMIFLSRWALRRVSPRLNAPDMSRPGPEFAFHPLDKISKLTSSAIILTSKAADHSHSSLTSNLNLNSPETSNLKLMSCSQPCPKAS